jgi:hypothetical protein
MIQWSNNKIHSKLIRGHLSQLKEILHSFNEIFKISLILLNQDLLPLCTDLSFLIVIIKQFCPGMGEMEKLVQETDKIRFDIDMIQ